MIFALPLHRACGGEGGTHGYRIHTRKTHNRVISPRGDKLWLGANRTDTSSWLIVFVLGMLAQFGIASVHFDRPKAGFVALMPFASTSTVAYASLGMVDDPYRYRDSLTPSSRSRSTENIRFAAHNMHYGIGADV